MSDERVNAIYLHISADELNIGDSSSITGQREMLTAFIKNHPDLNDGEILEFSDDGYNGSNFERPGVKRLLDHVRQGGVQCIIVKDFSRFGRNYIDVGDYLEQIFPILGIRFISVNDNYDSADVSHSAGDIGIAFKHIIHDYYIKDISRKMRSAWKSKKERGDYISPIAFLGYNKSKENKHKLVIDENAAEVVRFVFSIVLSGKSTTQTAQILNREGIPTPSAYKRATGYICNGNKISDNNTWINSTVYTIIRDLRYTGSMVNGKRAYDVIASKKSRRLPESEWIICENTHEAIISKQDFDKAQECIKKTSKKTQDSKPTILTGKVRCGVCGYTMQPSDSVSNKYCCRKSKYLESGRCNTGNVPRKTIEDVLTASLQALTDVLLSKQEMHEKIYKESKSNHINYKARISSFQKLIEDARTKKASIYMKYNDGFISKEEYLRQRDEYDMQITELEKSIMEAEQEQTFLDEATENPILVMLQQTWKTNKLTHEIVDVLVDRILVYGENQIEIVWKCENEFDGILPVSSGLE